MPPRSYLSSGLLVLALVAPSHAGETPTSADQVAASFERMLNAKPPFAAAPPAPDDVNADPLRQAVVQVLWEQHASRCAVADSGPVPRY